VNGSRGTPRVALIVDHPQRDLAGVVLTAFELCQRGVTCYLVPLNLQERETWALAPDFVLLNYARIGNERFARQLTEARIPFGVLDTEGGVWPEEDTYLNLFWRDAALLRELRCACMWGPHLGNLVVERGILSHGQVTITGCPRFDFYHPTWRPVWNGTAELAAPRILVNTNFSMRNPRFATVEQNVAQARSYGSSDASIRSYLDAERQAIDGMIALTQDLARDYPESEIVVRPHPFENPEIYERRFAGLKRVSVDNSQPVQPEICRAAVVIQRSCTTGLEAALAGVPTLSPQWVPAPALMPVAEMVSVPCDSYSELRTELDAIFSGYYQVSARLRQAVESVTHDWFLSTDGQAHQRVCDAVMGSVGGGPPVDQERCEQFLYGLNGGGVRSPRDFGQAVRHWLHIAPDFSFRRMRQIATRNKPGKSLDLDEVRSLIVRMERVRKHDGRSATTVTAALARDRNQYIRRFLGESVVLMGDG